MSLVSLIIDNREPLEYRRLTFGGVPAVVAEIEHGDIMAACSDGQVILVERKTPADLLGSLRSDRLFPQCVGLRAQTPWSYLVVVGSLQPGPNDKAWRDGQESGWTWSAVQGALLSIQEIGVHIVYCSGIVDYEQTIIRLGKRNREPLKVPPPRDSALLSEEEAILAALPSVGGERARALLDACGTPAWALAYLTDEQWPGSPVPGVARGIKRIVRGALGLRPGEVLSPITQTTANIETTETIDTGVAA